MVYSFFIPTVYPIEKINEIKPTKSVLLSPATSLTYEKHGCSSFYPTIQCLPIIVWRCSGVSKKQIISLSETKQKKLKDDLENGLAILTTKEQLDVYISSYGEIHRQTLQMAYDQIRLGYSSLKIANFTVGLDGFATAHRLLTDMRFKPTRECRRHLSGTKTKTR